MTAMAGAAMAAAVMLIACNKGQSENLGSGEVDAVTATGSALAVSKASDGVAGGVAGRRDFSSPPVAASATDEANAALQQKGPSGAADPLTAVFPLAGLVTAGLYWWLGTWRRDRAAADGAP